MEAAYSNLLIDDIELCLEVEEYGGQGYLELLKFLVGAYVDSNIIISEHVNHKAFVFD